MKLSFGEDGKPVVLYIVRMDDGKEVSARTPYQESGTIKSADRGKKVEIESLAGPGANSAMAEWKIVSIPE